MSYLVEARRGDNTDTITITDNRSRAVDTDTPNVTVITAVPEITLAQPNTLYKLMSRGALHATLNQVDAARATAAKHHEQVPQTVR